MHLRHLLLASVLVYSSLGFAIDFPLIGGLSIRLPHSAAIGVNLIESTVFRWHQRFNIVDYQVIKTLHLICKKQPEHRPKQSTITLNTYPLKSIDQQYLSFYWPIHGHNPEHTAIYIVLYLEPSHETSSPHLLQSNTQGLIQCIHLQQTQGYLLRIPSRLKQCHISLSAEQQVKGIVFPEQTVPLDWLIAVQKSTPLTTEITLHTISCARSRISIREWEKSHSLTQEELRYLESAYEKHPLPTPQFITHVAHYLTRPETHIEQWFHAKRVRENWRKKPCRHSLTVPKKSFPPIAISTTLRTQLTLPPVRPKEPPSYTLWPQ